MEALEYKKGNVVVLELKNRVDEFNTRVLGDEIHTLLNTGRFFIAIDLQKTNFLSADCLNEIWACQRRSRALGGDIVISGGEGTVLETINYVNFDEVVKRFYEIEESIAYLQNMSLQNKDKKNLEHLHANLDLKSWYEKVVLVVKKISKLIAGIVVLSILCPKTYAETNSKNTFTLEEVLGITREISPGIRIARLKMLEKDADVRMARSFGLPKIMATTGYMYESNPSVLSDVVNKEINNIHQSGDEFDPNSLKSRTKINLNKDIALVGVGFSQLIFSGGLFEGQVSLREAQKREANVQIALEMLAVEEQARNLFLGLLLTKEKLKYLQTHREAIMQRKKAASQALEMKTIGAVQFSEIELLEFKAEQELLVAEKDENSLRGLLNIMLDRPLESQIDPVPLKINKDFHLENADHYFDMALHRYPELRRTAALMDSAEAYSSIVRSQGSFTPQTLVFGSVQYSYGLGTTRQDLSWSLGVGMYMPLYDGRKSSAEMEKATSMSLQSRLAFDAAERKLRIDINDVVSEIRKSQLQLKLAEKALEISTKKKLEALEAIGQGQLPAYRMSEVLSQEMEARIAVTSAQAEFYRWHSKLIILTGQKENL